MESCFPPLAALSLRDKCPVSSSANGCKGKLEILQDLDLYYIRQIAHSLQEYDLEQKIEVEIKIREGTTKLLAACKHQLQTLEAAKNLLTSNERMTAYMAELQLRKKEPHLNKKSTVKPSRARVCLSDLRMPLIWKDSDHFKNKGDYRRFAVFCLVRIGTEVYDTAMISPVDRRLTDVTFQDIIVFNNISSDFEFWLEVYSHVLQDDLSMASTPRRIKQTIHSSISRTVGKKLAASLRDELHAGEIGPKFELVATAHLTLADVHDCIRTHDLSLENLENSQHQLPLFGHFGCRLAAQPDCISQERHSGSLVLLHNDGTEEKIWSRLQAFRLDMWGRREDCGKGETPLYSVTIDRDTRIKPSECGNTKITITNMLAGKEENTVILTNTVEEQQKWISHLMQHIKDHLRWQTAAERHMEIHSPATSRQSFFSRRSRHGSLYDETPIIEHSSVEYHPTVHEIFGLQPTTTCNYVPQSPSLRTRSYSIGTTGHRKWGSIRSPWPRGHVSPTSQPE